MMFERFQMAFQTQVGMIFLMLVGFLLFLAAIYLFLSLRQKGREYYSHRENSYFVSAEAALTGYSFQERPIANFFGRESIVTDAQGRKCLCTILPFGLVTEEVRARFETFFSSLQGASLPVFTSCSCIDTDAALLILQNNLLHSDGRKLLNLQQCIRDGRITPANKETILIELARSLAKLHERSAASEEQLYHGFLLPCCTYIDLDAGQKIKRVVIANLSLPFALGGETFYTRLQQLLKGKLKIDKWAANAILDQLPMLSPEQQDAKRCSKVGPASDFYSFGALAAYIFTGDKFTSAERVAWEKIPISWHSFLRRCLEHQIANRPKDFNDLEVRLADPELSLTHHGIDPYDEETSIVEKDQHEAEKKFSTPSINLLSSRKPSDQLEKGPFAAQFLAGNRAMNTGSWKEAKKHFQKAVDLQEADCSSRIKLAISLYELGDMVNAEKHYNYVRAKEPQTAKIFLKHIAFRM